ncbi:MAG: CGNR zinc finger domain-containing protein [Salinibacterium sp.]|nr:CGNR zinc finger domain-containing protein [Salinibacterium sp.]
MSASSSPSFAPAPGELEFVRQFVNTLDIEAGTDRLSDPATYHQWAGEHGVSGDATVADLHFARDLRESLRAALEANHNRAPLPPRTVDAMDAAAAQAHLTVRFTSDGARLVPATEGIGAVYGRVIAAVAEAIADKTWDRLKACAADDCEWGFYDTSRSRTGQWCSMSICGNRAKQARWRNRSTNSPAGS